MLKLGKSLLLIDYLLTFEAGLTEYKKTQQIQTQQRQKAKAKASQSKSQKLKRMNIHHENFLFSGVIYEMLTAIIIVARVQPGTSKGITDLLLPQPSSGLKKLQRSL